MSMKTGTALVAALVLAGCSGGAESPSGENASSASVQTRDTTGVRDSAGMAGMDHGSMAGMDHGAMAGSQGDSRTAAGEAMAGMDHSRMQTAPSARSRTDASATGRMAEMDHGNMSMSGQTRTMPGMGHAGMPGMRPDAPATMTHDAGMEKLRALVAELVQDPGVQAQIQADSALRRRWADEGVRRVLLNSH